MACALDPEVLDESNRRGTHGALDAALQRSVADADCFSGVRDVDGLGESFAGPAFYRFAETFRLSGCAAIDAAITRGLPKIAVNTILDPDKLRSDLGNVRAQGFAYDDREFHDDMRCDFGARIGPWGLLRSLGTDDRRCHLEDRSFR